MLRCRGSSEIPQKAIRELEAHVHRNNFGLEIDRSFAKKWKTVDSAFGQYVHGTFIPNRVRAMLEAEFPEAAFAPLRLYHDHCDDPDDEDIEELAWNDDAERWWLLRANRTLPPMRERTVLYRVAGHGGGRAPRGYDQWVTLELDENDGRFAHYGRSDLNAYGTFDLAETYEQFGKLPRSRNLIVSQAFRQWTIEQGLTFDFIPVIIDEDL